MHFIFIFAPKIIQSAKLFEVILNLNNFLFWIKTLSQMFLKFILKSFKKLNISCWTLQIKLFKHFITQLVKGVRNQ